MKLTILLVIQFMLNINSFYIKMNNKKIIVQKNMKQIDDDLFYFKCENKNNDECVKIINPKNKQNEVGTDSLVRLQSPITYPKDAKLT